MSSYDSVYLLEMFNRLSGRPDTDGGVTDDTKYRWLAEAQQEIVGQVAAVAPWTMYQTAAYGAFTPLYTGDNQVFTFGSDTQGNPIVPIGRTQIYRALEDIPDNPMRPGVDYLEEGTQIRIPHNRTYTGDLFWRGVVAPPAINASTQPALQPIASRELIARLAVKNFAESGDRFPEVADRMALWLGYPWVANPNAVGGFLRWVLTWKTAFKAGGALAQLTGVQLAEVNQGYANYAA